ADGPRSALDVATELREIYREAEAETSSLERVLKTDETPLENVLTTMAQTDPGGAFTAEDRAPAVGPSRVTTTLVGMGTSPFASKPSSSPREEVAAEGPSPGRTAAAW